MLEDVNPYTNMLNMLIEELRRDTDFWQSNANIWSTITPMLLILSVYFVALHLEFKLLQQNSFASLLKRIQDNRIAFTSSEMPSPICSFSIN